MQKFVNKTNKLRTVFFEDGSAVFLGRGKQHESSKSVKRVQDGVEVIQLPKKTAKKTPDNEEND